MRPNLKVKVIIVGFVSIFLFLYTLFWVNPCFKTNIERSIKSSYSAETGFIHINNNWTDAKSIGICTGEGTYSYPYFIENLLVNGSGFEACILIENSDAYFRLENCTLFNSGDPSFGINLYNVNNSQIINNTCLTDQNGICLYYSNDNIISLNKAYNTTNSDGISLFHSHNNIISENVVHNCGNEGISLYESNNNFISENNLAYNFYTGITLGYSDNNLISRNAVKNSRYGILLTYSFNNIILQNYANNSSYGIRLDNSYYNKILENEIKCNYNGIFLFKSVENLISDNMVNENLIGIEIFYASDSNSIKKNNIKNNDGFGLYLFESNYNTISGNIFVGNEICIKELACKRNFFYNNGSCTYRDILVIMILIFSISAVGSVLFILINSLLKSKRKIKL
jgi:parallel beta-helix repeat protein